MKGDLTNNMIVTFTKTSSNKLYQKNLEYFTFTLLLYRQITATIIKQESWTPIKISTNCCSVCILEQVLASGAYSPLQKHFLR